MTLSVNLPAAWPVSALARSQITPMIICKNEEANLARVLEPLTWAERILLIDSGSTDATLAIAQRFAQVDVLHRGFDSFAQQCNFGLSQITTPWVLSLDADHVLTPKFLRCLESFCPTDEVWGYRVTLRYCIHGRPLRGTLMPPRISLFRRNQASYRDSGHGHHLVEAGQVLPFQGEIFHDDRKSLDRWLQSQRRYQENDAKMLLSTPVASLNRMDRLRRTTLWMPILALPYCLIFKLGLLDGWRGWFYAFQRVYAELQLALMLLEADHMAEPDPAAAATAPRSPRKPDSRGASSSRSRR